MTRTGDAALADAVRILSRGGTVAFPTETVYGLGADATDARAVAGIYAAKRRPRFNPLIAHVADIDAAFAQGIFNEDARKLAFAFWPGPLTLVVPVSASCTICDLARAGLDSVALRVPAHPVAQDLLLRFGRPVAAPSANRSGRVSPTEAAHVLADLDGRIDALIDGGAAAVGLESSIVACFEEPALLRPGGISREAIEAVLGHPVFREKADEKDPLSPGRLASHYAPHAEVRLDATHIEPGEAVLLFGPFEPSNLSHAGQTLNLSPEGDLTEAAANLFAYLRRLDRDDVSCIAVSPIAKRGIGEAIDDRLKRAAAKRPSV